MRRCCPAIAHGDFKPLYAWLKREVHAKGSLHDTDTLMTQATGKTLDVDAFRQHLKARYLS